MTLTTCYAYGHPVVRGETCTACSAIADREERMVAIFTKLFARCHLETAPSYVLDHLGPCRIWDGPCQTGKGYGIVSFSRGDIHRVHRIAWTARHEPIPEQTPYVLHRCDRPPCFADKHLFLGTQMDNMQDMRDKGRQPYRT